MSSFGYTEIEYFWDSNDKVRTLFPTEYLLKQKRQKTKLHDVKYFNSITYYRNKWRNRAHTLAP